MGRLSLATRVFCLAAILGLSLALQDTQSLQATILLAAIGATAIAADFTSRLPESWIALTEAALASLVIAFALPDGFILLPYLVIPAFIAGVSAGIWPVVAVVATEVSAMSVLLIASGGFANLSESFSDVAPWLLTCIGVGALGAWARQVRYPGSAEIGRQLRVGPTTADPAAHRCSPPLFRSRHRLDVLPAPGLGPPARQRHPLCGVHPHRGRRTRSAGLSRAHCARKRSSQRARSSTPAGPRWSRPMPSRRQAWQTADTGSPSPSASDRG